MFYFVRMGKFRFENNCPAAFYRAVKIRLRVPDELNNRPSAPLIFTDYAKRLRFLDDIGFVVDSVILTARLNHFFVQQALASAYCPRISSLFSLYLFV